MAKSQRPVDMDKLLSSVCPVIIIFYLLSFIRKDFGYLVKSSGKGALLIYGFYVTLTTLLMTLLMNE